MLPTGPAGDTVAASSVHGNTLRRQPIATAMQSRIHPTPCDQPSTSFKSSLKPPMAVTTQGGEQAQLEQRVEADRGEVAHVAGSAPENRRRPTTMPPSVSTTSIAIATIASGRVRSSKLPPSAV